MDRGISRLIYYCSVNKYECNFMEIKEGLFVWGVVFFLSVFL